MRDLRIVFIHGYTASSRVNWYPNIAKMLSDANVSFVIPDLPGDRYPKSAEWLKIIHETVSGSNQPLVLVGHSLGTRAALLYLEKYQPKVKLLVLIAPLSNKQIHAERRGGEVYPDFFEHEIDSKKIQSSADKIIVIHSTDDDSVDYSQGKELAEELNAELFTYTNRSHFSKPENAQIIFEILQKELGF